MAVAVAVVAVVDIVPLQVIIVRFVPLEVVVPSAVGLVGVRLLVLEKLLEVLDGLIAHAMLASECVHFGVDLFRAPLGAGTALCVTLEGRADLSGPLDQAHRWQPDALHLQDRHVQDAQRGLVGHVLEDGQVPGLDRVHDVEVDYPQDERRDVPGPLQDVLGEVRVDRLAVHEEHEAAHQVAQHDVRAELRALV